MFSQSECLSKHIRGIMYENPGWHGLPCPPQRTPIAVDCDKAQGPSKCCKNVFWTRFYCFLFT